MVLALVAELVVVAVETVVAVLADVVVLVMVLGGELVVVARRL